MVNVYSTNTTDNRLLDLADGTNLGTANASGGQANQLYADLATAIAPNVNDIRLAFATQHILERDARAGTRYVEALRARWGVTSPDFRLQRAEYLGGGSTAINIKS